MTIGHGSTGDYTYRRMLGRLGPCVVLSQLVLWTMCAAGADTSLQVVVSSETAPSGGTAQFKIYLAHSARVASGRIVMDFDPAIFGEVANVEVFSASADAYGAAKVDHGHIDARFSSPAAGIAGPRDLPLFTVVVPILAVATTGATSVVTFSTGGTAWTGASGESYSLAIQPGQFTVKGALSISNVTLGGGLLAAGTVVEINGGGFHSMAALEVPGVSVSAVQVLGPQQILMTLDAPADLTGKRVRVRNPDGERAEYVSSLRGNLVQSSSDPALASIRPLMPRRTQQFGNISRSSTALALENSNSTPVDVVLTAMVLLNSRQGRSKP